MRRALLRVFAAGAVAVGALGAHADPAMPRIGFLSPSEPQSMTFVLDGLREGLREHGYVDGANIRIEPRFADNRFDRLQGLARELVGLRVDVLATFVTQASLAAKRSTATIPIVMIGVGDPVGSGLVASLSRPGANVTGTSGSFVESAGKRLQLLKEIAPGIRRVAILWNPDNPVFQAQMLAETAEAARPLGIELDLFEARDPRAIDAAFLSMAKRNVSALNVMPDPMLAANYPRIAALAARMRLPSVTAVRAFPDAGGLLAYGPSFRDMARKAGGYVAKILKGAKPGDLPVEQPTQFDLVVNLKTAKEIGLGVPDTIRLRAEAIE